jgi:hypothetical protein
LELSIPTPADATVTTAKIAANAVDETKLKDALVADFTEVVVTASDSILLGDATDSGNTKRDTVQGLLDLVPAAGYTSLSTVAFSSGTSATVSGFPSTATRIIIGIDGMSSVGSTDWAVKLGDSGGIETSGYTGEYNGVLSWVNNVNSDPTSQFDIFQNAPTIAGFWGTIDMLLVDATANKWQVMIWVLGDARATFCYGMKSLTSTLTQVEISNASANDAGAINAAYI